MAETRIKRRWWSELDRREQRRFIAVYARTGNLEAAAREVNLHTTSAREVANEPEFEEMIAEIRRRTRERIIEAEVKWAVAEVERLDEVITHTYDALLAGEGTPSASGLDKLIRLKAFLLGEADSRAEQRVVAVPVHGPGDPLGDGGNGEVWRLHDIERVGAS